MFDVSHRVHVHANTTIDITKYTEFNKTITAQLRISSAKQLAGLDANETQTRHKLDTTCVVKRNASHVEIVSHHTDFPA